MQRKLNQMWDRSKLGQQNWHHAFFAMQKKLFFTGNVEVGFCETNVLLDKLLAGGGVIFPHLAVQQKRPQVNLQLWQRNALRHPLDPHLCTFGEASCTRPFHIQAENVREMHEVRSHDGSNLDVSGDLLRQFSVHDDPPDLLATFGQLLHTLILLPARSKSLCPWM